MYDLLAYFDQMNPMPGGDYSFRVSIPHRLKPVYHVDERGILLHKYIVNEDLTFSVFCKSLVVFSLEL